MDRFVALSLVVFAASQVLALDIHDYPNYTVGPWEFQAVCPDACKAPTKHMDNCYLSSGAEPCECDEPYPHQLNACYLCAVDSITAGDTVPKFEDFDAKAAQASLDHLYDNCQLDKPIDRIVFGADVFVASSSSAPASLATASSEDVSSTAAAASTASSTPATPASTGSAPSGSALAGNATASAPQPTKSGSARGLSSATYSAAACAVVGALATFFL